MNADAIDRNLYAQNREGERKKEEKQKKHKKYRGGGIKSTKRDKK
jgi:hypothetical protein